MQMATQKTITGGTLNHAQAKILTLDEKREDTIFLSTSYYLPTLCHNISN